MVVCFYPPPSMLHLCLWSRCGQASASVLPFEDEGHSESTSSWRLNTQDKEIQDGVNLLMYLNLIDCVLLSGAQLFGWVALTCVTLLENAYTPYVGLPPFVSSF